MESELIYVLDILHLIHTSTLEGRRWLRPYLPVRLRIGFLLASVSKIVCEVSQPYSNIITDFKKFFKTSFYMDPNGLEPSYPTFPLWALSRGLPINWQTQTSFLARSLTWQNLYTYCSAMPLGQGYLLTGYREPVRSDQYLLSQYRESRSCCSLPLPFVLPYLPPRADPAVLKQNTNLCIMLGR